MNIEQLRKLDFKVRATHYRYYRHNQDKVFDLLPKYEVVNRLEQYTPLEISPLGGYTIVEITLPCGQIIIGDATCSIKDNYCKRVGNQISIERAFIGLAKNLIIGI